MRRQATGADWAGAGLRLNAVAPGMIDTPMVAGIRADAETGPMLDMLPIPVGRPGRPEEIAALIEFLLGPDARVLLRLGRLLRRRQRRPVAHPGLAGRPGTSRSATSGRADAVLTATGGRRSAAARADRRLLRMPGRILVDTTPLRESRDFRLLFTGQLISMLGNAADRRRHPVPGVRHDALLAAGRRDQPGPAVPVPRRRALRRADRRLGRPAAHHDLDGGRLRPHQRAPWRSTPPSPTRRSPSLYVVSALAAGFMGFSNTARMARSRAWSSGVTWPPPPP